MFHTCIHRTFRSYKIKIYVVNFFYFFFIAQNLSTVEPLKLTRRTPGVRSNPGSESLHGNPSPPSPCKETVTALFPAWSFPSRFFPHRLGQDRLGQVDWREKDLVGKKPKGEQPGGEKTKRGKDLAPRNSAWGTSRPFLPEPVLPVFLVPASVYIFLYIKNICVYIFFTFVHLSQ